jgi:hypothetical protein
MTRKGAAEDDRSQKKAGYCYYCDEEARGKTYGFVAGFLVSTTQVRGRAFDEEYIEIRKQYRDLTRHEVFLCRPCARMAWRWYQLRALIPCVALFVILFGTALALIPQGTWPLLLIAGLMLVLIGAIIFVLWKGLIYRPTRNDMEAAVICLVRRRFTDFGDSFFTTAEAYDSFEE